MTVLLWVLFVICVFYFWVKGHWLAWVVVWFPTGLLCQMMWGKEDLTGRESIARFLLVGLIAAVPMIIRKHMEDEAANQLSANDLRQPPWIE